MTTATNQKKKNNGYVFTHLTLQPNNMYSNIKYKYVCVSKNKIPRMLLQNKLHLTLARMRKHEPFFCSLHFAKLSNM